MSSVVHALKQAFRVSRESRAPLTPPDKSSAPSEKTAADNQHTKNTKKIPMKKNKNMRPKKQKINEDDQNNGSKPVVRPVVRKGVSSKDSDALYKQPPSFVDHLPWVEGLEADNAILLQDNRSVAAVFEITPKGTEGRTEDFLTDVRDAVVDALQDTFDEHDTSPWVMQTYTFNELDLEPFMDGLEAYVDPAIAQTEFTQEYMRVMRQHIEGICKPQGLFFDKEVTHTPWSGQRLRNYLVVYRLYGNNYKFEGHEEDATPLSLLNESCEKLFNTLGSMGIGHRRLSPREFHDWMTQWFNAYTSDTEDPDNPIAFSKSLRVDEDEALPFGNQFAESLFYSMPRSDHDNQAWWFDATATRCISIDGIKKRPTIGHITGETRHGDAINTLMDQLPEGSMMTSTVVFVPQDAVEIHIEQVAKSAIGDSSDAERTKKDCEIAKEIIGDRHKLYRANYACYVRARDIKTLNRRTNLARSILLGHGFRAIAIQHDIKALDNYLLNLPMKYDPDKDRANAWRQAQLTWVQHIANLSPFFGRSVGTGNPGIVQFNRGGEPFTADPLNKKDRKKNAHLLILGPTGSGKSVSLSGMLTNTLAVHRPRMFIIEAGNSFGLIAQWYESLGLTVNRVSLKPGQRTTLPTFADAKYIEDASTDNDSLEQSLNNDVFGVDEDSDVDDESVERDILGEMEVIATLMITGGEQKEMDRMLRADKHIIRKAILLAARHTKEQGIETLTEHVRDALYEISEDPVRTSAARQRIREMGDSMGLFCDGFAGEVFNSPGKVWPEADVTLIDLGHFVRDGYEAHMAISVISLLNMINNIAERDQYKGREIVVTIDEAHLITTSPLLSPFLVKIAKMWRKLGAWLWLATQDMDDFPDNAGKLLNLIEWWMCLVMEKSEIGKLEVFKELTPEEHQMLLSMEKADRQYTEGVLMAKSMNSLFRCVPPSLILALSMTEKHEKVERATLMRELGVDEVAAAKQMAIDIDTARGIKQKTGGNHEH